MEQKTFTRGYEPLTASDLEVINLVRSYQKKLAEIRDKRCKQLGTDDFYVVAEITFSSHVWANEVSLRSYYYYETEGKGTGSGKEVMDWRSFNVFEAYANGTLTKKLDEILSLTEAELNIPEEKDVELFAARERINKHP